MNANTLSPSVSELRQAMLDRYDENTAAAYLRAVAADGDRARLRAYGVCAFLCAAAVLVGATSVAWGGLGNPDLDSLAALLYVTVLLVVMNFAVLIWSLTTPSRRMRTAQSAVEIARAGVTS